MVSLQITVLSTLILTCFAFPMDFDIRDILKQLNYYSDVPQVFKENIQWPDSSLHFGQVVGLDVNTNNDVVVFHRGARKWQWNTFNRDNTYALKSLGPIVEDTIVNIDPKTGQKTKGQGANQFYMPHGLTIDGAGNYWVTDVALHQVFRFSGGKDQADLTLGKAFIPGSTNDTFCKPTDVAVASNGDFFVSDGYCNSRVLKFSKDGQFLKQFGRSSNGATNLEEDMFHIPHSLALVEELDLICVADRENSRASCFNAGIKNASKTGEFDRFLIKPSDLVGRVFAIEYSPVDKLMYAVVTPSENDELARGYTVNMNGQILNSWGPVDSFSNSQPHDVTVSKNGNDVYVGDISNVPRPVIRFSKTTKILG